jgi:hypothetical protein
LPVKESSWGKTKPQLFHFRTQSGQEVDVVMEDAVGRLVGGEVKASATANGGDFKGLHALREMKGNRFKRGVLLYARCVCCLTFAPTRCARRLTKENGVVFGEQRIDIGCEVIRHDGGYAC